MDILAREKASVVSMHMAAELVVELTVRIRWRVGFRSPAVYLVEVDGLLLVALRRWRRG